MGRTGRAGLTGAAHTLVTVNDKEFAGHLVRNLESSGQVTGPNMYFANAYCIRYFCGKLSRLFAGCEQGAVWAGDAEQLVQEQQVQGRQGEGEYWALIGRHVQY